jgi:transcriptional regulator with XRE-family HTH domain
MSNPNARPELEPFAEFVKAIRKSKGLKIADVAEAMGVAPIIIYKIEDSSRPFVPREGFGYDEYARVLGCTAKELKALRPKETPLAGTVRRVRANSRLASELRESAMELERVDSTKRDSLVAMQQLVRLELLEPFTLVASNIDGLLDGLTAWDPKAHGPGATALDEEAMQQWKVVAEALGTMAAAAGAGAAAGGLAAFAAFAGVAALGTASTGAAIGSLSGAAATSATLAALGGGSLAAGGWGIIGGTALLTGLVAVPAVLAAGVAALMADRYAYRKLLEQGVALEDAQDEIAAKARELLVRWHWAELQQAALSTLRSASARPMAQLSREVKVSPRVEWAELGVNQIRVRFLALVVSTAIEAMSLPTWTPATDDQQALDNREEVDQRYESVTAVAEGLLKSAPS